METLIKKLVNVKSGEIRALLWSFAYFFFLLATYYMLLPLRDAMGIEGGTRDLKWLFAATMGATLITVPLQGWVASRLPRAQFVPVIYLFLVTNMIIFWVLMRSGVSPIVVARALFVWVTVFSVFTVSVFWSFQADLYSSEQSKRLFGFIGAGGSLGSIFGPLITRHLVEPIGVPNLLLVASVLLVAAVLCAGRLEKAAAAVKAANPDFVAASAGREKKKSGGMFEGFPLLFKSSYLGGIGLWVFLLSFAGTMLYFLQAEVVTAYTKSTGQSVAIFATIAQWVGILSLVVQLTLTGRIIPRIGVGRALALLPMMFVIGFAALALSPVLLVVAGFQAVQRATNFGVANLARESLWTVVSRDEKFKAKNIVDGTVFRGADAINAQVFDLFFRFLGLAIPIIAGITAAVAVGWGMLSLWLGRSQEKRSGESGEAK